MAVTFRSPPPHPSPLRRREFRLYFAGNMASNIGNWISNVAMAVYMLELTGSSLWVGVVGLGLFLPVLGFALPAGVLADRTDRLRLMRTAQLLMALLSTALAVTAGLGLANRYFVALVAFGLGIGVAVAIPTMQALIPNLVPHEELGDAIRLNALTFNVARAAGPVIAAALLTTVGATWAFAINAFSFVFLVVALTLIRRPPFERARDGAPGPIREGIAYAWRHLRTRSMLLGIVAIGISLEPITTLSPALAVEHGWSSGSAGWIVAVWGSGAVTAIVLGRGVIRGMTEHGLGWIGLLALAAGIASMGAAHVFLLVLVGAFLAGVGNIGASMVFTTTIQSDVPESLRGRVSALWTLAFLGPRAFFAVVAGALADAIGPRSATIAFSAVALVTAILMRRTEVARGELVPPPT